MVVIGIDLGTTYSCVGVWKNDRVEIVANDAGNRTTPSYVSFNNKERVIGEAAKNQMVSNPANTIYDAKRVIGRNEDDSLLQEDMKNWQFNIVFKNKNPFFKVTYLNEEKLFRPEEISAMVLSKMKSIVETYVGENVTDAVITVPAYFNDSQKECTKNAGKIAGLNVLRIINEPTAAALAYGLDTKASKASNIIVYDLGGGTFDVSLLRIDASVVRVLATDGNTHLGGEDFDQIIVEMMKKQLESKVEISQKLLRKLKPLAENIKRRLSAELSVTIEFEYKDEDYQITISRAKFENECNTLFKTTLEHVDKVLKDGKIDKSEIDEIVLVGGSTRIPKIKEILSNHFGGKVLCEKINPDEAVAYGATILAATLTKASSQDILLVDVTALGLGVETQGGLMSQIIASNTQIPCKITRTYSTSTDNQTSVLIKVFEGMRPFTKDNHLLGTFELLGIPPAPRAVPQIEVTFELDRNGILQVSAMDSSTKKQSKLVIASKDRLTSDVIEQLKKDAEKYEKEDAARKHLMNEKYAFDKYLNNIKNTLLESPIINGEEKEKMMLLVNEGIQWCEQQDMSIVKIEDFKDKFEKVAAIWNPIIKRCYEVQNAAKED